MPPSSLQIVQEKLLNGSLSCLELVNEYLKNIEASAHLNIYIEVFRDEIREKALLLDQKIKSGVEPLGKLFGAVISLKDVLAYKDHELSAGSKILSGYKSPFSANVVERILEEDALIIGRVNCDEFAMGSGNEYSHYGPTINGIGENMVPGGSSGGSAVSVQKDTCLASLGSDTGGSVRQPAAFCGIMGFKPSYGKVSRYGLIAYASSFDQIGILANDPFTIASIYSIIGVKDARDSTSMEENEKRVEAPVPSRFVYFKEALHHSGIDPVIKAQTFAYFDRLRTLGHTVEEKEFPFLDYVVPAYYVLTTAEASSNLSRYDGVRYGHRSKKASNLNEVYTMSRTEGFGPEVKRRIMLGTFVLSSGYYDAYFSKAQKIRSVLVKEIKNLFLKYDYIISPTSPVFPWKINEKSNCPVEVYLSDIFTVLANLTGLPAISFPTHESTSKTEPPTSIQIMAGPFKDESLIDLVYHVTKSKK